MFGRSLEEALNALECKIFLCEANNIDLKYSSECMMKLCLYV